MNYWYVVDSTQKIAVCFAKASEAKKMAIEKKSLIYRNKRDLPEWVEKVEGVCDETQRRSNGKFVKRYAEKYFNLDIKGE